MQSAPARTLTRSDCLTSCAQSGYTHSPFSLCFRPATPASLTARRSTPQSAYQANQQALSEAAQLMQVVNQLTSMFNPDFKVIKKRIEDLIDREYLERDKDNSNLYRYLA